MVHAVLFRAICLASLLPLAASSELPRQAQEQHPLRPREEEQPLRRQGDQLLLLQHQLQKQQANQGLKQDFEQAAEWHVIDIEKVQADAGSTLRRIFRFMTRVGLLLPAHSVASKFNKTEVDPLAASRVNKTTLASARDSANESSGSSPLVVLLPLVVLVGLIICCCFYGSREERPRDLKVISKREIGDAAFCPALMVNSPKGVSLLVCGFLQPLQENGIVDVQNVDANYDIIAKMCASELGNDKGVFLNSALGFPLAFMNTSRAVYAPGTAPPTAPRVISIYREFSEAAPYATVDSGNERRLNVCQGKDGPQLCVMCCDDSGNATNIIGVRNQLFATVAKRYNKGQACLEVNVACGCDAGFILCLVVALMKLKHPYTDAGDI